MLIAGAADLHGKLNVSYPEAAVGLIAGDLMPLMSSAEDWKQWQELDWLERKASRWLKRQVARTDAFFFVPGNHDIVFYSPDTRPLARELMAGLGIIVLDDPSDQLEHGGVKFSGYPYTPTIQDRNWAFSQRRSSPAVEACVDAIPEDTDVLISHGPPQFLLDGVERGGHVGCAHLLRRVLEVGPAAVFCGHVHEQRGLRQHYFGLDGRSRRIINCSIVDEDYNEKGGRVQTLELLLERET